jgi:hypothetical protein
VVCKILSPHSNDFQSVFKILCLRTVSKPWFCNNFEPFFWFPGPQNRGQCKISSNFSDILALITVLNNFSKKLGCEPFQNRDSARFWAIFQILWVLKTEVVQDFEPLTVIQQDFEPSFKILGLRTVSELWSCKILSNFSVFLALEERTWLKRVVLSAFYGISPTVEIRPTPASVNREGQKVQKFFSLRKCSN